MLDFTLLKPADILLFKTTYRSSLASRFIVWAQETFYHVSKQADYCHVALVDKDTSLMLETTWPKTRVSKIDFSIAEQIEVYRVRGITDEQREKALIWGRSHIGEWYDVLLFLTGWIDTRNTEICSTFVSKAFREAGLDIPYGSNKKELILPDDFGIDTIGLDRIM